MPWGRSGRSRDGRGSGAWRVYCRTPLLTWEWTRRGRGDGRPDGPPDGGDPPGARDPPNEGDLTVRRTVKAPEGPVVIGRSVSTEKLGPGRGKRVDSRLGIPIMRIILSG